MSVDYRDYQKSESRGTKLQNEIYTVCTCNITSMILTQFVQYHNIDQITLCDFILTLTFKCLPMGKMTSILINF